MKRFTKEPELTVKAFSVRETSYDGPAFTLLAEGLDKPFAILPGHANMLAVLRDSHVSIDTPDGEKVIDVDNGILKVSQNQILLFMNV